MNWINQILQYEISIRLEYFLRGFCAHGLVGTGDSASGPQRFGFNPPWWDRPFGTYRDRPRGGHQSMVIGVHGYRDPSQVNRLAGMLALPFVGKISGYSINHRQWSRSEEEGDKRPEIIAWRRDSLRNRFMPGV